MTCLTEKLSSLMIIGCLSSSLTFCVSKSGKSDQTTSYNRPRTPTTKVWLSTTTQTSENNAFDSTSTTCVKDGPTTFLSSIKMTESIL